MSRRKRADRSSRKHKRQVEATRRKNKTLFLELCRWFAAEGELFRKDEFHGNIKWQPEALATQALIWSWQETKYVTDAFEHTQEVCDQLGLRGTTHSYTSMMNALARYHDVFARRLTEQFQTLAAEVGGRYFRTDGWVPIAFDGSRATAPRSVSNERAFCAPNYGHGQRAKYGKKKSKGMRRRRNQANPPQPQAPQAWITMLWHMGLRLPWTWRLGPSQASERDHVKEILAAASCCVGPKARWIPASRKQIVRFYKMRWGIEVEFRGLKQTIDKHTLRCRDADRLLVELDWSLRAMAVAELLALREQIAAAEAKRRPTSYDPNDRSLANTMRTLRRCMRNLNKHSTPDDGVLYQLSQAVVQRYHNRTDKRARYRRKNPDKKPLGEPTVRKLTAQQRKRLTQHDQSIAL